MWNSRTQGTEHYASWRGIAEERKELIAEGTEAGVLPQGHSSYTQREPHVLFGNLIQIFFSVNKSSVYTWDKQIHALKGASQTKCSSNKARIKVYQVDLYQVGLKSQV